MKKCGILNIWGDKLLRGIQTEVGLLYGNCFIQTRGSISRLTPQGAETRM